MIPRSDHEILITWWKLVKIYSNCRLTFARDKLIAFSAVARQVQMRLTTTPTYLAGLWVHRLTENLLWYVPEEPTQRLKEAQEYRAPSWSWAAIDEPVDSLVFDPEPPRVQTKCVCRIIRAVTDPQADPLGAIGGAYLRAQGLLLRARVATDATGAYERPCKLYVEYSLNNATYRVRLDGTYQIDFALGLGQVSEVFLFAVQMRYFLTSGRLTCAGLILAQNTDCKGQYRRIGLFTSVAWADFTRLTDKVPLTDDHSERISREVLGGLYCHDACDIERSLARWQTYVITII